MRANLLNNLSKGMNFSLTRMCERLCEMWAAMSNHAIITQLSRNNHPIAHRCIRYATALLVVLMVGYGEMWAWNTTYLMGDPTGGWSKNTDYSMGNSDANSRFFYLTKNNYFAFYIDYYNYQIGPASNGNTMTTGDGGQEFSATNTSNSAKYTGNTGIVEVHVQQSGNEDNTPWVWLTRPTVYIRHKWNNDAASTVAMTDNNDGTYKYTGYYSSSSSNIWVGPENGTSASNIFKYFTSSNYTKVGSPTNGDKCIFEYNASGYNSNKNSTTNRGTLTVTKLYSITYNGNSKTSGTVPTGVTDAKWNVNFTTATQGTLARTGYVFVGWNTASDGTGRYYAPGVTYAPTDGSMTLYAMWLQVHSPAGIGNTYYGEALTQVSSDYYEVYRYAVSSGTVYVNAGTSAAPTTSGTRVVYSFTGGNSSKDSIYSCTTWMAHSKTYSVGAASATASGEFPSHSVCQPGLRQGQGYILAVTGYDQFSMYVKDANTSGDKKIHIFINNVDVSPNTYNNAWGVRRHDLDPDEVSIIRVVGHTDNNNQEQGFSLRLPAAVCGATQPGEISKGTLSACTLRLTAGGSAATNNTWYWQSASDGTDKTVSGATKDVTSPGTYYIRSYYSTGKCWSDAQSVTVSASDLTPAAPTALAKSSVTAKGVTLTVTDAANTNDYEFYVSTDDDDPESGTTATHSVTSAKSLTITDLYAGTTFYAWARAKCGSYKSAWTALTDDTFTTSTVSVTHTLTNVTKTSGATSGVGGSAYTAVYAAASGYALPTPVVTIGGNTATSGTDYTWTSGTGTISIPANKITGDIVITMNSAATAPTSVAISGTYHYYPGETISLTATPTGGNGPKTYQWYHGGKADGNAIDGATSATFEKASCVVGDAGDYYCKVTCGGSASRFSDGASQDPYKVKIMQFYLKNSSGSDISNHALVKGADASHASLSLSLTGGTTYKFRVTDGCGNWYGNSGEMTSSNCTDWAMDADADCRVTTNSKSATYTFNFDFTGGLLGSQMKVSVVYPEGNQASGKVIYWDNSVLSWDAGDQWYRIGKSTHNNKTQMSLVSGTANLYKVTTAEYNGFEYWHIANNEGEGTGNVFWTKDSDPTTDEEITHAMSFEGSPVTADAVTVTPGTDHSTGGSSDNNNCEFYSYTITTGMKTDRVTISSYSNGTITVNYVDTDDEATSFTSGYADVAHTCKLTSITAVPATGYTIDDALTINEASYAANYVVTGATTVAASFKPATYSVTLNTNSGTINSGDVDEYTYLTGATLPTDVTRSGYRFMGWYASSDFSTDRVYTIGTSEYGNKEYWAKWAQLYAITDADPDNGSLAITDGSSAITEAIAGETVYIVATPSSGYVFDEWNIYKTGTPATTVSPAAATASTSFTMPAYGVTVDATFAEVTYSLSYDKGEDATGSASGGTAEGSYTEGTTITVPAQGTLANEGYTFRGWTDGTTFYTAGQSFTMPASDVELAAVWDDGASGSTKYYYGQVKIVADTLQKNLSSASICFFTNTSGVIASSTDLSFTANPNTGGIYYYSNDLSDTELSKSSNWKSGSEDGRYIRGLKFANGTDYTLELGTNVASSIKFYGWCGSASKTMTVGGQSFTSNSTKNTFETNNFTKSGGFTGDVTISQDADFYGILVISIGAEATHFKVSFDDQKGFAGSSALPADIVGVPSGKKILPPSDPTASGYTFSGWYTDAACTSAVNWNTMTITENRTLYAKWCTVAHDITWVVNGETYTTGDPTTSTTDCDGIETMPTAPSALTCSDSFRGWSETNIYGEAVDTPPADLFVAAANAPTINEDKTFYAVFATQDDPDDARTAEQMKEYSFTSLFTSKAWADAGSLWTSGKDGTNLTTGRGVKVETGATGAYATTASSYKGVKEVIVTYSTNASAGAGAITIEVGSTAMSGSADVTKTGGTTDRTITYKPASAHFLDGKVKITVTCTTNAIYIKSVQVIYSGYHEYRCICPSLSVTPKLVTASTPIFITSAAEKTVRSQDSLQIVGSGLQKNATLSISSPASKFVLKSRTGADLTTSATGAIDTVAYIYYTPGEGDTDDGLDKNNSFTITDGTNTETVSTALIGRHLPANFVIAAKSGDKWYALPADKSNNTQDPVEIEVDDDDDPTLVTTTEANVYSWYGQTSTVINGGNGHTTRLEMHGIAPTGGSGHAPLFGSSGTGTSLGQSGPTTLGGSAGSDYWWIFTQTNTSVSATTDVKYNMTVANSNTKHVRINSNKWGLYTSGVDEIRLIPWTCATPAAPTIGGTQTYTTGETITLEASHDGSNHDAYTTYTWYKGATFAGATEVQAAAIGSSGYTLTIASCDADDAGTYWCEASNGSCTAHNATGYAVDVPLGSHTLTWAPNVNTGESSIGTASKNSTTSLISNSTDMSNIGNYGSLTITSSAKDKLTSKIGTPASYDADKYMYVTFDVPSGYQFTPTNISVKVQPVTTNKDVKLVLSDAGNSITKTQTDVTEGTITTITETNTGGTAFTGTVTLKIYCYGATDDYRLGSPITISGDIEEFSGYVLTWNTNGGSELECTGTCTEGVMDAGDDIVAPTDPTMSNYTFDGWKTNNDGTGTAAPATMPSSSVTYYASWKQTVTLNTGIAGSGADKTPYVYLNGAALSSSAVHSAAGYTLNGYYTATSAGTKVLNADGSFAGTAVTDYITSSKWSRTGAAPTLYAQWTENLYNVTYNKNDEDATGSTSAQNDVHYVTLQENGFALADHLFVEWNTKSDGSGIGYAPGEELELTGDLVLYAIWSDDYSVSWGDVQLGGAGATVKPNLGGGNYTITATISTWDGDTKNIELGDVTEGVTASITGTTATTVTITFAVGADVEGDAISLSINVPAHGDFGAKTSTEDIDIENCSNSGSYKNAVLFSQNFGSATEVAYAANTARAYTVSSADNNIVGNTPASQFTSITCNAKGSTGIGINSSTGGNSEDWSGKFGAYYNNTSAYWSICKTSNFASTAPTAVKITFDALLAVVDNGTSKAAVNFLVGSGFSDGITSTLPAASKIYTGFGLQTGSTSSKNHTVIKVGSTTALSSSEVVPYNTMNSFTWVINNSESSITYTAPNSTSETVAAGTWDLWIGTSKVVNDKARASSGSSTFSGTSIQNMYIGSSTGNKHEFHLDNVVVTDISPIPSDLISSTLTWTPALNTDGDWDGTNSRLNKETGDADFTFTVTSSTNSAGAITYASSNTSVATVNSTTGKVHIAGAAGNATITATMAESGCYEEATATYNIAVVDNCDDVPGTIETTDLGCSGTQMTVSGHTGEGAGATYQWYKDGASIGGATSATYTATAAGEYYVVVTNTGDGHCAMTSTNTIVVEALSGKQAKRLQTEWYVKNGRRTPDIALVQTGNAKKFIVKNGETVLWDSSDGDKRTGFGGCGFYLGDDEIIYLKGTQNDGSAPSGLTGSTDVTLTIKTVYCDDAEKDNSVTIHCQAATSYKEVAFVVDGTEGGNWNAVTDGHADGTALYEYLDTIGTAASARKFQLTERNIYKTVDDSVLREHYSQFDAILITDNPSTDKMSGKKSYVDAFGTMIDIRPILTMEAYVSKLSNWKAKGINGSPTSPNPRQYGMKLECKNHEIFAGLNESSSNIKTETVDFVTYWTVLMVDSTKSPYTGVAYNVDTKGNEKPALQGFSASDVSGLMLLGQISNGTLFAGVERQDEPAARLLLLGVNAKALPNALTPEGKRVIANALSYLCKTNMEDVDDCSTYFTGKAGSTDWNTADNWSKGTVPNSPMLKVRILKPCVVPTSTKVRISHLDIVVGGTSKEINTTPNGSLTIPASSAVVVAGTVNRVKAPYYGLDDLMPTEAEDLKVEANSTNTGALILDNEKGDTKATVEMYSQSYWETVAGKKKKYWSYVGVPIQEVDIPNYFYLGFTYLYDETSGWTKMGDGSELHPFEGIGLSMQSGHKETFYGTLASTETREITLTKTAEGGNGENLIGNSWTAPIQIANFDAEDFGDATATVYVYNTGKDASAEGSYGDESSTTPGQWVSVPVETAKEGGYTGLKVIPAMNAFQVNTTTETTLTLDYDKLVRKGASSNDLNDPMRAPRRQAAGTELEAMMRVRVSGTKTHTDVWLQQDSRFTDAFDNGWEAKYAECDNRSAQFYAQSEIGNMAFLALPDMEGTVLGFAPSRDGNEYTFTFHYVGEETFYLNDLKLVRSALISEEGSYTFTYEEGDTNRFYISRQAIDAPAVTTGVDPIHTTPKAQKILYQDKLYILYNGRVFDATGKVVK